MENLEKQTNAKNIHILEIAEVPDLYPWHEIFENKSMFQKLQGKRGICFMKAINSCFKTSNPVMKMKRKELNAVKQMFLEKTVAVAIQ